MGYEKEKRHFPASLFSSPSSQEGLIVRGEGLYVDYVLVLDEYGSMVPAPSGGKRVGHSHRIGLAWRIRRGERLHAARYGFASSGRPSFHLPKVLSHVRSDAPSLAGKLLQRLQLQTRCVESKTRAVHKVTFCLELSEDSESLWRIQQCV